MKLATTEQILQKVIILSLNKINSAKKIELIRKYPITAFFLGLEIIQNKLNIHSKVQILPPSLISIYVSEKCNLKCSMCANKDSRQRFDKKSVNNSINFIDIIRLVDEVKLNKPMFYLIGGEPLLCKEIFQIIRFIHKNGMITSLTTNGWFLKEKANDLIESGIDFISISIDGDRDIHDRNRGVKGSFERAVDGIKELVDLRNKSHKLLPNIKINCVIGPHNIEKLSDIIELAKTLNVDELCFEHFSYYTDSIEQLNKQYVSENNTGNDIGGMKIKNIELFNKTEIEALKKFFEIIVNHDNEGLLISFRPITNSIADYYSGTFPSKQSKCRGPFHGLTIRQNGDIEVCQGIIIGNIKNDTIHKIWNCSKIKEFRSHILKNSITPACFRCCSLNYDFQEIPNNDL